MEGVIDLKKVRYSYPGSMGRDALQGIDLSIKEGEYLIVCGASGSGKSTFAYLLNGLIPHFFGGRLEGSVEVKGVRTKEVRVSDLFPRVGIILQNADAQLFNTTVEDEISFGLESLGLSKRDMEKRMEEVVEAFNLGDLLKRSPVSLSGGEKRLVSIASVLCLNPEIVVLDEPSAHLDWEGRRRIKEVLLNIHRMGKTVVLIEQRPDDFLQDSTSCLIMEEGQISFFGSSREARDLLVKSGLIPRYSSVGRRTSRKEDILEINDIQSSIGHNKVLKGVSIKLKKGETTAIVGRNGSGKTTLIRHLNGLLRPERGYVKFKGKDIRRMATSEMARWIGLSFQNPNDQFFRLTVMDELLVGRRSFGRLDDGWIQELIRIFGLSGLLERSPYFLSEGEKKRVAIASIMANRPDILVLDEPTAGQDGRSRMSLTSLIRKLEEMGISIVIVTHDLEFARFTTDRWVVIHEGRVVWDGIPEEIYSNQDLLRLGAIGSN